MKRALLMFLVHVAFPLTGFPEDESGTHLRPERTGSTPGAALNGSQGGGVMTLRFRVVQQPGDFQDFDNFLNSCQPGAAARWSELMLSARRVMNSGLLAALAFIIGGFFCTLLLNKGVPTRTATVIVLYLGLFLSLAGAAFCFNLAGFNPTWMSYALFSVWAGLVAIALFEFGWKHLAAAVILYVISFQVGRLLAALFVHSLLLSFVRREHTGPNP